MSILLSSSRLLLQVPRVTLPIYIALPTIPEVPHHHFIFGERYFFHTLEFPYHFKKFCHQCRLQFNYQRLYGKTLWSSWHQTYWFKVPNESSSNLGNWASCFFTIIPFFHSFNLLVCPCSLHQYLILMQLCWFSGCKGKIRGQIFSRKEGMMQSLVRKGLHLYHLKEILARRWRNDKSQGKNEDFDEKIKYLSGEMKTSNTTKRKKW